MYGLAAPWPGWFADGWPQAGDGSGGFYSQSRKFFSPSVGAAQPVVRPGLARDTPRRGAFFPLPPPFSGAGLGLAGRMFAHPARGRRIGGRAAAVGQAGWFLKARQGKSKSRHRPVGEIGAEGLARFAGLRMVEFFAPSLAGFAAGRPGGRTGFGRRPPLCAWADRISAHPLVFSTCQGKQCP